MFRANSSRPQYRITYYEFSIDGQEKWLVKVEKKVLFLFWGRYKLLKDHYVTLLCLFTDGLDTQLIGKYGFTSHDQARKWALDEIQNDSETAKFNGAKSEGVWL